MSAPLYVVDGARQTGKPRAVRVKLLERRQPTQRTISAMTSPRLPLWYRHAWWLPAACSAFAVALAAATLRPSEQGLSLTVAILCALPWSLALLLLDFGHGFADRASIVVCIGLCANLAILWWSTTWLRARHRHRYADRFSTEA